MSMTPALQNQAGAIAVVLKAQAAVMVHLVKRGREQVQANRGRHTGALMFENLSGSKRD